MYEEHRILCDVVCDLFKLRVCLAAKILIADLQPDQKQIFSIFDKIELARSYCRRRICQLMRFAPQLSLSCAFRYSFPCFRLKKIYYFTNLISYDKMATTNTNSIHYFMDVYVQKFNNSQILIYILFIFISYLAKLFSVCNLLFSNLVRCAKRSVGTLYSVEERSISMPIRVPLPSQFDST